MFISEGDAPMATFITRVELHNHQAGDYETLHKEMQDRGFERTIKNDKGKVFKLPTAEYVCTSDLKPSEVCNIARTAADVTGRKNWIITCQYTSASFYLDEA